VLVIAFFAAAGVVSAVLLTRRPDVAPAPASVPGSGGRIEDSVQPVSENAPAARSVGLPMTGTGRPYDG
jgi:hypothetical protein